MISKLKAKLLFFIYVFVVLLFANLAKADWVNCYNEQQNRVYFTSVEKAEQKMAYKCKGEVYYQAANGYQLIQETFDNVGNPTGEAGSGKMLTISNGRKFFISKWNDWSKHSTLMVLEPNFKTKKVTKHCQIITHSDAFSTKYDEKTKVLKIRIRKKLGYKKFKMVWEDCKI